MKVLLLRFDAPLVSFGASAVDHHGVVQAHPALSMLVGLFANALGWDHRDTDKLEALQERLRHAARIDREGEALVDYQTVTLGLPWMIVKEAGWTTRGRLAGRGGASGESTHIRLRHYRADSVHTVAVALADEGAPTVEELAEGLQWPVRPVFIGRKCCLPAAPIFLGLVEAPSLVSALAVVPRVSRGERGALRATWWHSDDARDALGESRSYWVTDERDWTSRVHLGRRLMREGRVVPPEERHG